MNDRKQHVINKAQQLFIEKGYQATSIQDIIDFSGISKGTFYNYFSSKNELLMAIFTFLNQQLHIERNRLLVGQSPADIETFICQLELQMEFNRKNKLLVLFEEVFVSNDQALKKFLKRTQIKYVHWIFDRFMDIFGRSKEPYLLDCAIMFIGMLHQNIHFHFLAKESDGNYKQVIRYTVGRMEKMVEEIDRNGVQLLNPGILEKWLPECQSSDHSFKKKIEAGISTLKKCLRDDKDQMKYLELLDFIQEETKQYNSPRKFLIKSALLSLKEKTGAAWETELKKLEQHIEDLFTDKENL
jgi:AcrR family transcriptional regulator